jgi:hypothetical protein
MAKDECQVHGDRIHIGPDVGAGDARPCVRHHPDHKITRGWVKPLKDGEPLNGAEVLSVRYDERVGDFEVQSLYDPKCPKSEESTMARASSGPAMVASNEYRSGWDRIFGHRAEVGEA